MKTVLGAVFSSLWERLGEGADFVGIAIGSVDGSATPMRGKSSTYREGFLNLWVYDRGSEARRKREALRRVRDLPGISMAEP
jgi:hypothetical protein